MATLKNLTVTLYEGRAKGGKAAAKSRIANNADQIKKAGEIYRREVAIHKLPTRGIDAVCTELGTPRSTAWYWQKKGHFRAKKSANTLKRSAN